ncbi:hypothetical protein ACKWTF_011663 [Chironomus riparius]
MKFQVNILFIILWSYLIIQSSQANFNLTESSELFNPNYEGNDKIKESILPSYTDHEDCCENCRRTMKLSPFAKLLTTRYIVPVFRITTCIKLRLLYAKRMNQYIKI